MGVNWDITKARATERIPVEQHRLIQMMLPSVGDAVITPDGQGAVR